MKVLRVYKIMKENNVSLKEVAKFMNIKYWVITHASKLEQDFTINQLKDIKIFLVNEGIIDDAYDYTKFLDVVDI